MKTDTIWPNDRSKRALPVCGMATRTDETAREKEKDHEIFNDEYIKYDREPTPRRDDPGL
jgi:hypothetical protein